MHKLSELTKVIFFGCILMSYSCENPCALSWKFTTFTGGLGPEGGGGGVVLVRGAILFYKKWQLPAPTPPLQVAEIQLPACF